MRIINWVIGILLLVSVAMALPVYAVILVQDTLNKGILAETVCVLGMSVYALILAERLMK